jgi:NAD dependent epimerase/dehydratase
MKLLGKTILITGAGGFIGSHVVEEAVRRGARVRAFVRYNSRNDWGRVEELPREVRDSIEVCAGDVRDGGYVRKLVKESQVVLHLAALIGIPFSYIAPESYIQVNVEGALNVLKASLEEGVERVVHTSSSEVYGTAQYVPIDENHPLQPQSPYSASKIAADMLAESFYRSFDLPVIIIRPFNTYGPRQSARAVIPSILSQLASGNGDLRLGDVEPVRDFTYVEDMARAFLDLACCDDGVGKTVNVGTGEGISIGEMVKLAMEVTGVRAEVRQEIERLRPPKSEVYSLVCSSELARELIRWEPKVKIRDGLAKTWDYIQTKILEYKAWSYNV